MRIAIVGCGYVGTTVGRTLVQAGHDVLGTTTSAERGEELRGLGIEPHALELAHSDRLQSALREYDTAVVMVAPNGPDATHRSVYLEGIRHLVDVLPRTAVRHVLYTSSTSVYGQSDGSWVDEESPTQPTGGNGQVLVETERELLAGARRLGLTATILRLAGIIGPGRGPANRVPSYAGRPRDDGDAFVNLIHRDDIVTACVALVEQPHDGVLNLSDGRPIRRRDYYDRLIAATGLSPIQWIAPAAPADQGKRVSNARIIERFGLTFRDAAEASVHDLFERHRANNGGQQ